MKCPNCQQPLRGVVPLFNPGENVSVLQCDDPSCGVIRVLVDNRVGLKSQRTLIDDVIDYLKKGAYEDAGVTLGQWFNERLEDVQPDFQMKLCSDQYLEAITSGFEGEVNP